MIMTPRCRNPCIITDKITARDIVAQRQENKAQMRKKTYQMSSYRTVTLQKDQFVSMLLNYGQFSRDCSEILCVCCAQVEHDKE